MKVIKISHLVFNYFNIPKRNYVQPNQNTAITWSISEIDKFVFTLSDIDRLIPRLKCLLFKHKYPHMISDARKALKIATRACKEVRKSGDFRKLLEYILLVGNIMNSGSCKAKAVGFDLSYLPKV